MLLLVALAMGCAERDCEQLANSKNDCEKFIGFLLNAIKAACNQHNGCKECEKCFQECKVPEYTNEDEFDRCVGLKEATTLILGECEDESQEFSARCLGDAKCRKQFTDELNDEARWVCEGGED